MPLFDAADCLAQFNALAARPTTDAITDANKYARLSRSQRYVVAQIASRFPQALYPKVGSGSFPTLTTTDNQVFTFGNDANGQQIAPIGRTMIYTSLDGIPNDPWTEGVDYLWEGSQIRIPNNGSYSGTLYWRGVQQPVDIAAGQDPVLLPFDSRILIVVDAVMSFAVEGARNLPLYGAMKALWDEKWAEYMLMWKTAYADGGALVWGAVTGRQMALLSQ